MASLCAGLGGASTTASAASGSAGTSGQPPSDGATAVVLEDITPSAPGPDSTVRITGHVRAGERDLQDLSVRLRFSPSAFVSRGVMQVYAAGGSSARFETRPLPKTATRVAGKLASGETASFNLTVEVSDLNVDEFGVFPLGVEAVSGDAPVARQRTFLPYTPEDSAVEPTRAAWLWPVVDRPHRAMDGMFVDDELAQSLSTDGRLARLVSAAGTPQPDSDSPFPLTWAIDPALLRAARDMSDGYAVREGAGNVTRHGEDHQDSAIADEWLDRLRTEVGEGKVLSVPYADPDVMAIHRAGLDKNLTLAVTRGPNITSEVLGRDVTSDVVWPPGGWLDQDTLDTLAVAGTNTVILNEDSLPPAERLTYTPNAATATPTIGGSADVLLADRTITRILGEATREPGSAVLARQRFLAETALITDERPYDEGTLLIAPPRRWDPPPGFAAEVLESSADVPWLTPTGLSQLKDNPATVDRAGPRYPQAARRQELDQDHLDNVRSTYRDVQGFAAILEPRTSVFDFALLRTESSAWRDRGDRGRQLRELIHQQLQNKRQKVEIVTDPWRVLASNSGTVPITISNGMNDRSVAVSLSLRPRNRARLDIDNIPERITIQPGRKATVKVQMSAVTSGVADVVARLETPEGEPYGEPVNLKIRATGYGSTALAVTGGALGFLFLGVAVRVIRRTLQSRPGDDSEEPR